MKTTITKRHQRLVDPVRALAALERQATAWAARAAALYGAAMDLRRRAEAATGPRCQRKNCRRPATSPATLAELGRRRCPIHGNGKRLPRGQGAGSVCAEILRRHGKPMRVNDLLDLLAARGIRPGGRSAYATLAATLQKLSSVELVGRGLWAARGGRP